MSIIAPCLWFATEAEEAAAFYVSLIANSRIDRVVTSPVEYPGGDAGAVLLVEFTLDGRPFQALNGGSREHYTNALSLSVQCADQAEVDRLWDALVDGGAPVQCGWLNDRYGVPWQIVPAPLIAMMSDPDREKAARAMTAMMGMVKLEIAALEAAFEGR